MKYKNNTLNTITYDSQYSSRGITLQPNEEITIPFYIDPARTDFTLVSDDDNIDPIMLNQEYILSSTPTVINVPKPKMSSYYRLSIRSNGTDYELAYNKSTNHKVKISGNQIYSNMIIWEFAPRIVLTSDAGATVIITLEETYSI